MIIHAGAFVPAHVCAHGCVCGVVWCGVCMCAWYVRVCMCCLRVCMACLCVCACVSCVCVCGVSVCACLHLLITCLIDMPFHALSVDLHCWLKTNMT